MCNLAYGQMIASHILRVESDIKDKGDQKDALGFKSGSAAATVPSFWPGFTY